MSEPVYPFESQEAAMAYIEETRHVSRDDMRGPFASARSAPATGPDSPWTQITPTVAVRYFRRRKTPEFWEVRVRF